MAAVRALSGFAVVAPTSAARSQGSAMTQGRIAALGSEGDTVNLKREYFVLLIFITHVRNQPQLAVRHDFLLGGSRTNGSASLSFCRLLPPFLLSEFPKQVSAASEEGGGLHPCRLQPRCGPARGTKRLTETEPSASLQDSQAHRLIPWDGGVRLEQDRRLMEAKAGERHDRKQRG